MFRFAAAGLLTHAALLARIVRVVSVGNFRQPAHAIVEIHHYAAGERDVQDCQN